MPGRVFVTRSAEEVGAALDVGVPALPDPGPNRNIAPGQTVLALGPEGLGTYRWGIVPVGRTNARGRPVMETIVNARSETVFDKSAFDGVGRAVLPVEGWYEWTGAARKKTPWEIRSADGSLLLFAAITDLWTAPGGLEVPQLATVTCPPNTDLQDIHHRMAVILRPEDVSVWLHGDTDQARGLMIPWADGLLSITKADPEIFTS